MPANLLDPAPVSVVDVAAPAAAKSGAGQTIRHLITLTKPRLNAFSVATAIAAYAVAEHAAGVGTGLVMALGTALSGAGALALNQWLERDIDARMRRTRSRPLPSGELSATVAFVWAVALGVLGLTILAMGVNLLSAAISALTIILYLGVYTPLKRRTNWATEIGAISGALPPLIGSAAAGGGIAPSGWFLFAVLLFWQMPHFYAIGWVCRDEYRKAGFNLLPAMDATGRRTARWTMLYTCGLLLTALLPVASGDSGLGYAAVSLVTGGASWFFAIRFARAQGDRRREAWQLFTVLLIYLPVVMTAYVWDRLS